MDEISLNSLLGEEYTYCKEDPMNVMIECMDIQNEIISHYENLLTLEAAKEVKKHKKSFTGGTGPLPTNTKPTLTIDDFDEGHDKTVEVDFEEKIGTEKNSLYTSVKRLLTKIKEWIQSIVFKLITLIRKDELTLRNPTNIHKINTFLTQGKALNTYPFPREPETLVQEILQDISRICNKVLTPSFKSQITDSADLPFVNETVMGISLNLSREDILKELRKKLLGGALTTRSVPLLDAHITIATFDYFIKKAPADLKDVQKSFHVAESVFPSYDVASDTLNTYKVSIFVAQKAIFTSLQAVSKIIFHISSLIHQCV